MNRNRKIVAVSILAIAVLVVTAGWSVLAGAAWPPEPYQSCSLTGTWTVTSPQFGPGEFDIASYGPEDPKTGRVAGILQILGGDPTVSGLAPDGKWISPMYVTSVRTGPDTFQETSVFYLTNDARPRAAVTWILVVNVADKATDPDTLEWNGTYSVYSAVEHPGHMLGDLPDQDKNNDGVPDEGQQPIVCMPINGVCHRIGLMPLCEPTPMPSPPQQ
jgi:hypothetical protein